MLAGRFTALGLLAAGAVVVLAAAAILAAVQLVRAGASDGSAPAAAPRSGDRAGAPSMGGAPSDLSDYGAACDGRADDRPALQRALDAATRRGGGVITVSGDCRIVQTGLTVLKGPITIRGTSEDAALSLDSDQPGAFRGLFTITGEGAALEDLTLRRASAFDGVMLSLQGASRVTMDNIVIDGRNDDLPDDVFHGISLGGGPGDRNADIALIRSTIENTDYGLLQDSAVTAVLDGFTVDRSTFRANHDDDLEFNAPSGTMTDVTVTGSTFSDNRAADDRASSGFGVGLANVQRAVIRNNTFEGYRYEPVHIEDRSAFVTVDDNRFSKAFTAPLDHASHVFIVNGAHHITVTDNTFDTAANENPISCVYASPGGGVPVHDIRIAGNLFLLRPKATAVADYGAADVEESANITRFLP